MGRGGAWERRQNSHMEMMGWAGSGGWVYCRGAAGGGGEGGGDKGTTSMV